MRAVESRSARRASARKLRVAALGVASFALLSGAPTALASPFPGSVVEGVDAWLDHPLPADAPPGSEIVVGATIWSSRDAGPVTGSSVFFRLYSAAGLDEYAEVVGTEDWTGHFSARLTVPEGGVGELDIGTQGTACDANGCSRADALYAVAGVGPPDGAPLTATATATVARPTHVLATGEPIELTIRLVPRADWEAGTFDYPQELRLIVREPRGADLDDVVAVAAAPEGTYRATFIVPEPGEFAVQVAVDSTGSPTSLFATSTLLLTAEVPASATPVPTAPPSIPRDDGGPPLALMLAIIIALAGVAALAALGRRGRAA